MLRIFSPSTARELMTIDRTITEQDFWTYWGKLTMAQRTTPLLTTSLPGKLHAILITWQQGLDTRKGEQAIPRNTFYRYRKAILEATGDDISLPYQPTE